jgi:hypothetical protein
MMKARIGRVAAGGDNDARQRGGQGEGSKHGKIPQQRLELGRESSGSSSLWGTALKIHRKNAGCIDYSGAPPGPSSPTGNFALAPRYHRVWLSPVWAPSLRASASRQAILHLFTGSSTLIFGSGHYACSRSAGMAPGLARNAAWERKKFCAPPPLLKGRGCS